MSRAFSKSTFSKISFRNTIRVANSLDPDQAQHLSGLIWVRTVCKAYQQTPLVGKKLKDLLVELLKWIIFTQI